MLVGLSRETWRPGARWRRSPTSFEGDPVKKAGVIRDISTLTPDIDGRALAGDLVAKLAAADVAALPAVDTGVRLAEPVGGVGKFICVGLNYSDHARESGMTPPEEPILFMKATSAVCGSKRRWRPRRFTRPPGWMTAGGKST